MSNIIIISALCISVSVIFTGIKITESLNKNAGWEKQKAYMNGIEAQYQTLPLECRKGQTYILRTIVGSGGKIETVFYPGYE